MGLWRGKKGSSVFYKIANSNSAQKQGIRERNYEPANPQSEAQASQRMRMYPAQAVYGALKSVIERSWQGTAYGEASRREFLKRALTLDTFPAIEKGQGVVVPGPYQIAKGTLVEIVPERDDNDAWTFPTLIGGNLSGKSIGEMSQSILDNNSGLKEGDQLTFIVVYRKVDALSFTWLYNSFYLNTTDDTEDVMATFFSNDVGFSTSMSEGEPLALSWTGNLDICAVACIVSREGTTPLRSNATLVCDTDNMAPWYGLLATNRARASYMKKITTANSDWPADQDGEGTTDTYVQISGVALTDINGQRVESSTGGNVTGGGRYLAGETVSLEATPNSGYRFVGWYTSQDGTTPYSTAAILAFEALTSRTLYALFAEQA